MSGRRHRRELCAPPERCTLVRRYRAVTQARPAAPSGAPSGDVPPIRPLPAVPDVQLLPIDAAMTRDIADPGRVERAHGIAFGEHADLVRAIVAQTDAYTARIGAPAGWGGFLAVDAATRLVVGTCGFKGGPDADGRIEIAYFTLPSFEGRGWATAMGAALLEHAARGGARLARAHTLPEANASSRVLRRLGFAHEGEVDDPEDGRIWRWGRALTPPA